eukprot:GDKJ01010327.1.p1 GENE.GDKJ01010327.1~~GDKJ01010327.1.p1  ORF type:complete len:722 (-),score=158.78 GDKJ01010327.1:632-2752(-)
MENVRKIKKLTRISTNIGIRKNKYGLVIGILCILSSCVWLILIYIPFSVLCALSLFGCGFGCITLHAKQAIEFGGLRSVFPFWLNKLLQQESILEIFFRIVKSGRLTFYVSRVILLLVTDPNNEEDIAAIFEGWEPGMMRIMSTRGFINLLPQSIQKIYKPCPAIGNGPDDSQNSENETSEIFPPVFPQDLINSSVENPISLVPSPRELASRLREGASLAPDFPPIGQLIGRVAARKISRSETSIRARRRFRVVLSFIFALYFTYKVSRRNSPAMRHFFRRVHASVGGIKGLVALTAAILLVLPLIRAAKEGKQTTREESSNRWNHVNPLTSHSLNLSSDSVSNSMFSSNKRPESSNSNGKFRSAFRKKLWSGFYWLLGFDGSTRESLVVASTGLRDEGITPTIPKIIKHALDKVSRRNEKCKTISNINYDMNNGISDDEVNSSNNRDFSLVNCRKMHLLKSRKNKQSGTNLQTNNDPTNLLSPPRDQSTMNASDPSRPVSSSNASPIPVVKKSFNNTNAPSCSSSSSSTCAADMLVDAALAQPHQLPSQTNGSRSKVSPQIISVNTLNTCLSASGASALSSSSSSSHMGWSGILRKEEASMAAAEIRRLQRRQMFLDSQALPVAPHADRHLESQNNDLVVVKDRHQHVQLSLHSSPPASPPSSTLLEEQTVNVSACLHVASLDGTSVVRRHYKDISAVPASEDMF